MVDLRRIYGPEIFPERREFESVTKEISFGNRLISVAGFYTGVIESGNFETQTFRVKLTDGAVIKAVAIVDNPASSLFLKLRPGDRVAILHIHGVGGIILRKLDVPVVDTSMAEDADTLLSDGVQYILRNGVFFKLIEDDSAEVSVGNPFGFIKILGGGAIFSHNSNINIKSAEMDAGLGFTRRPDGISEDTQEFYLSQGDMDIRFSSSFIANDLSFRVPIVDPILGTLYGRVRIKDSSLLFHENGLLAKQKKYFFIDFPTQYVHVSEGTSGVSIEVGLNQSKLNIDVNRNASGVSVDLDYSGKKLSIAFLDIPETVTDQTTPRVITSEVVIKHGDSTKISISDDLVFGATTGDLVSPVALRGGIIDIPFGPVVGTSPIDLKRAQLGVQNLVNLLRFTTPAGPITVSGPVSLSGVIVDGSGKVLAKS